ncbi:heterokaryon incompatibility protein-domain-containing protein [Pisolithus marmoratus]|nr:heterokaryon incompatibility protein-domain-containing protein [Pisolithus marmoratus]
MKLLDVKTVLDRDKDIQEVESASEYEVMKDRDDKTTKYAILSHRWGAEVSYEEMTGLMKMEERKRDEVRERGGYHKIIKSCEQAMKDGYEWLWSDTCCIDKRSSAELSEAINSMYRWYRNAHVCYAYLHDVEESDFPTRPANKFSKSNGWPEWFARGWTLQELVAPKQLEFFNKDWLCIGNKRRLAPILEDITRIPIEVLRDGLGGAKNLGVAQIMSWAADRKTTRVEDRAYSLLGLFDVSMPMLYGEGNKAFRRLQLEIIRTSSDHSIFAWSPRTPRPGSVLADDPSDFRDCRYIEPLEPHEFVERLVEYIKDNELSKRRKSSKFSTSVNPIHRRRLSQLKLRARTLSQQFRTFSVSNAGIQVSLPLVSYNDSSSHYRAILACSRIKGYHPHGLITIDLASSGSSFDRIFDITGARKTYPEFRTLHLTHHQDVNHVHHHFTLDDKNTLHYGFAHCGTFPRDFIGNTVTLSSLTDDLIILVYANEATRSRFAVALGYYLGQGWVHITSDERPATQEVRWTPWLDFAKSTYDRMWAARAEHARTCPPSSINLGCKSDLG